MLESEGNAERRAEPGAAEIHAALERILSSDAFRAAPQLSAFLSFIVERERAGRAAELKGYTIAVEAFGRPTQFDPQSDPIVRVEAGRLRKALRQFYLTEGAQEPVRITIPVGGYVPAFHRAATGRSKGKGRAASGEGAASVPGGPSRLIWPWLVAAAICMALLLALAILAVLYRASGEDGQASDPAEQQQRLVAMASTLPAASATSHLPVIVVIIDKSGGDQALLEIGRNFKRLLIDAMARFDDLVLVRSPAPGSDAAASADYVFELNAARVGTATEGFGQLRSVRDGRIVWTTSAIRTLEKGPDDPELTEIARRLAIRLAEPFGIIHADYRQFSSSPAMNCLTRVLAFRRSMKPDEHLAARNCLLAVLENDPGFHPAWSQLARLTIYEHAFGFNPLSGPPLDRALAAALTAVRLAPSSARAQQALMDVYFSRGAIEDAFRAGREATARNPYDPDIMADIGARYVQLNRPAEGLPLLQRAIEMSSGRPPWYDFFAFLAAYLTGADNLANSYSAVFVADGSEFSLLGLALQCARAGDEAGLGEAVRRLDMAAPQFGADTRLYLARKGFVPAVIDKIIAEIGSVALAAIGPR